MMLPKIGTAKNKFAMSYIYKIIYNLMFFVYLTQYNLMSQIYIVTGIFLLRSA